VCFNVSGLGGFLSQPRSRYARSGPQKVLGDRRRLLNQASGAPFDCQAIVTLSQAPLARPAFSADRSNLYAATGAPTTANRSLRRSTAQAIQLVGEGDDRDISMALAIRAFAHRPSGVSLSATCGRAARAP
jgi:hypothetical protein